MSVVRSKQLDVPRLVKFPIGLQLSGILSFREHQSSEKPCGAPVSVRKRMDTYSLGMHDDSQLPRRPVVGVLPTVGDGVERVSQVNGNPLRRNPNVQVYSPPPSGPGPHRTEHLLVKIADEAVAKQRVEWQRAVDCRRHQVVEHPILKTLFEVIDRSAADGLVQDVNSPGEQRAELVMRQWGLTVAWRQRHQGLGSCCLAM